MGNSYSFNKQYINCRHECIKVILIDIKIAHSIFSLQNLKGLASLQRIMSCSQGIAELLHAQELRPLDLPCCTVRSVSAWTLNREVPGRQMATPVSSPSQ